MDLQTMKFFVTTADEGSFSAAAESLNYAQSNLSSRIKQLEDELGELLFYRHRKGVKMTAKGELFYSYAQQMLKLSEETITAIKYMDEARGQLRIGSIEATVIEDLPELFAEYHAKFPEVQLTIKTDINDPLIGYVRNRSLDGAFVAGPVSDPALGEIRFRTKHLALLGSMSSPNISALQILEEEPLITFPEGSIFRHRFELLLSSHSLNYSNRLHTMNSLSANIVNICAGIGYGYLPLSLVSSYVEKGLMKQYPLDDPFSDYQVVFIYRKDRLMDAAFRFFIDELERS